MKRLILSLALVSCSSAVPTGVGGVEKMGATVLRYRGPEIELALGYRFATMSLGDDWLILNVAMTAAVGKVVDVRREGVFLLTPQGQRIPLASQEEFVEAYAQLQARLRRAAIASEPLDYFNREQLCGLEFFAPPGEGLAYSQVSLDDRRVCQGNLFFFVPGGIQPGVWTLGLDLVESRVRLSFRLEAR